VRHVVKGEPPPELDRYLETPGVTYDHAHTHVKDAIRRDGVRDQFNICCYCCSRLSAEQGKQRIEHVVAQSRDLNRTLDWQNLLISCSPDPPHHGFRARIMTCDEHKADDDLPVTPLQPDCEQHFQYYRVDGRVVGATPEGHRSVEVLNLNTTRLCRNRLAAMDQARELLELLPRHLWEERFLHPHAGELPAYEPAIRSLVKSDSHS
jgi:uncharacterized protein (TIGR02646 family)